MEIPEVPHGVREEEGISLRAADVHGFLVERQRTFVLPEVTNHMRQCLERANQLDA
jgi:hypothetical protein